MLHNSFFLKTWNESNYVILLIGNFYSRGNVYPSILKTHLVEAMKIIKEECKHSSNCWLIDMECVVWAVKLLWNLEPVDFIHNQN